MCKWRASVRCADVGRLVRRISLRCEVRPCTIIMITDESVRSSCGICLSVAFKEDLFCLQAKIRDRVCSAKDA